MRKAVLFVSAFVFTVFVFHYSAAAVAPVAEKKITIQKSGGLRLGVILANPSEEFLHQHNLDGGALVLSVDENSPAEEAGIEEDDIIVEFDGKPVEEPQGLADMVKNIKEEKTVNIVVNRDGEEKEFKVALRPAKKGEIRVNADVDDEDIDVLVNEALHLPRAIGRWRDFLGHAEKGGYLGVKGADLSNQLKEYFEVEYGVLIEKVVEDSPAEEAGLKAGDVIYKINDRAIKDVGDLIRTVNYYNPDEKITVYYVRKGKKSSVTVTLGKKEGAAFHPPMMPKNPRDFRFFFKGLPGPEHIKRFKRKMPMLDEDVEILVL